VYPGDEIFVGNVRMLFSTSPVATPTIFVEVDPGVFNATVGECEASPDPVLCNCTCYNGCSDAEAGEMSYYATPALVVNGSLSSGAESRRRVATLETREVDEMLELIFDEDQRVFQAVLPDQGSLLANANARHIAGGAISVTENCAIQVRVKDCSGNLQVWLRPNTTFIATGSRRRRAPALQRGTFECQVHTFGTPDIFTDLPITAVVKVDCLPTGEGGAETFNVTIGET
jgi:hypothetical protein